MGSSHIIISIEYERERILRLHTFLLLTLTRIQRHKLSNGNRTHDLDIRTRHLRRPW